MFVFTALYTYYSIIRVSFMVFNTTFNNSSVISRQSVLLVEESGENNMLEFTDKLYHIMLYKLFM
jgi:hypothetical protein